MLLWCTAVFLTLWLCVFTVYVLSAGLYILRAFFKCLICVVSCRSYVQVLETWRLLRPTTLNHFLPWLFLKACSLRDVMLSGGWRSVCFWSCGLGGHTHTHTHCFVLSFFSVTHRVRLKWKSLRGGNGHRQTPPLPPGSKEVEGWRGQAAWPGKGLKEQGEGGAVWIDRAGRWMDWKQSEEKKTKSTEKR